MLANRSENANCGCSFQVGKARDVRVGRSGDRLKAQDRTSAVGIGN